MTSELGKLDALVIGEGPAGFAAALTLREQGKRVAVLAKSPGAASVSSGRWSFGSDEALAWLLADWHPPARAELVATARRFAGAIEPHLSVAFATTTPYSLPDSSGRVQKSFAAQKIQVGCHSALHADRPVRLLGSPAWRFRADRVAEAWNRIGASRDVQALNWEFPYRDVTGRCRTLPRACATIAKRSKKWSRF